MLTAASCQPMPGPARAAWPTARPGSGHCEPYPSCCPPAPDRWSWLHAPLADAGPDTGLHGALGLMVRMAEVFIVTVLRTVQRLRVRA